MSISVIQEHLKIARRLRFQGAQDEAVSEYIQVLKLDPNNVEAKEALKELNVDTDSLVNTNIDSSHKLKTDFFVHQAEESNTSILKRGPIKLMMFLFAIGSAWALYSGTIYILNFESIRAKNNVEVHFLRPRQTSDNAYIDVEVKNYNPAPVKHITINYKVFDKTGTEIKDAKLIIEPQVPAGETRTFEQLELGLIDGQATKLQPVLAEVKYGPIPKLNDDTREKYVVATAKSDNDNLEDFLQIAESAHSFAPAYIGLGSAYGAKGNWRQAIVLYRQALEIDGDDANAHYLLGIALYYNHERKEAEKEIREAAKLAPDDPDITRNLKYFFSSSSKSK